MMHMHVNNLALTRTNWNLKFTKNSVQGWNVDALRSQLATQTCSQW